MNAPLDPRRLPISTHQARLAETTPPAGARAVADPRCRRLVAAAAPRAGRIRRVVERILVVRGAEPVPGATPAMLGRHVRPEAPPR